MRYFYAVVTMNKRSAAAAIYNEFNGFEFELTSLKLNLSFVADEQIFPQEVKEVSNEVPVNYSFDSSRISRALNHSTVKLSWDQTDPRMTSRLATNYKKVCATNEHNYDSDEEKDAYKGLLANSEDSSSEESGDDKAAKVASMRAKLLGEDIDFTGAGKNRGDKRGEDGFDV